MRQHAWTEVQSSRLRPLVWLKLGFPEQVMTTERIASLQDCSTIDLRLIELVVERENVKMVYES